MSKQRSILIEREEERKSRRHSKRHERLKNKAKEVISEDIKHAKDSLRNKAYKTSELIGIGSAVAAANEFTDMYGIHGGLKYGIVAIAGAGGRVMGHLGMVGYDMVEEELTWKWNEYVERFRNWRNPDRIYEMEIDLELENFINEVQTNGLN